MNVLNENKKKKRTGLNNFLKFIESKGFTKSLFTSVVFRFPLSEIDVNTPHMNRNFRVKFRFIYGLVEKSKCPKFASLKLVEDFGLAVQRQYDQFVSMCLVEYKEVHNKVLFRYGAMMSQISYQYRHSVSRKERLVCISRFFYVIKSRLEVVMDYRIRQAMETEE